MTNNFSNIFTKKEIGDILNNSILIKSKHNDVYNYKDKYIIKFYKQTHKKNIEQISDENICLNFLIENGVKINQMLGYGNLGNKFYSVFKFYQKDSNQINAYKFGQNLRKMHNVGLSYKGKLRKSERLLEYKKILETKKYVNLNVFNKLLIIYKQIKQMYLEKQKQTQFQTITIVHGDIGFSNIICPDILIDTEHISLGNPYEDLGYIFNIGYRNGDQLTMKKILDGYNFEDSIEENIVYMYLCELFAIYRNLKYNYNAGITEIKSVINDYFVQF